MKRVLLVGNPNVGKTSLFNILTAKYQKVGNWTGVTVDRVSFPFYKDKSIEIVDLPGAYSLNGNSIDERVVSSYLKREKFDLIINVIDGMNLERNLELTFALLSLKAPMIMAVNFSDDLIKNKIKLDDKRLSELLGVPIVLISARKKKLSNLTDYFYSEVKKPDFDNGLSAKEVSEKVLIGNNDKNKRLTYKLDSIFLNKFWGICIFAFVVFSVYFISLKIGGFFSDYISNFFIFESEKITFALTKKGVNDILITFLIKGIIGGVGQVASFLPQLLLLSFSLAFLEECGYMSRVAFLMDRLFRSIGINGKSVFPLVLSLGCTVSGIEATRTIEEDNEREKTILLIPFMPCGAKTVVFIWGAETFFSRSPFIAFSLFILGLFAVVIMGRFLLKRKDTGGYFLLEMPVYRFPNFKNILSELFGKLKDFLFKVGSVIFTTSVVYWFLLYFGFKGYTFGKVEGSFLFSIGNAVKYIFYPLGFYDWRIVTSLFSGIIARESVIGTFGMSFSSTHSAFISPIHAYSFLAFIMLSPPCIATVSEANKEFKDKRKTIKMLVIEFCTAYVFSFILNILYTSFILFLCLISAISVGIIIYRKLFCKSGGRLYGRKNKI